MGQRESELARLIGDIQSVLRMDPPPPVVQQHGGAVVTLLLLRSIGATNGEFLEACLDADLFAYLSFGCDSYIVQHSRK